MIEYHRSAYGLSTLLRVHGSAVYRGMVPGLFSALCCVLFSVLWADSKEEIQILHPYPIGLIVAAVTFLLIFRAQQGYARYWEATSAVHHMLSKWTEAACHTGVYHLQCHNYDHIKPPSFYDYPELDALSRTRNRENNPIELSARSGTEVDRKAYRAVNKSIETVTRSRSNIKLRAVSGESRGSTASLEQGIESLEGTSRLDGGWGKLFDDGKATFFHETKTDKKGFASASGGRTAPLFLQELAHLSSLLSGVALATLRNDIEGAESPLDIYEPGSPWPAVDPDMIDLPFMTAGFGPFRVFNFLGIGRTPRQRTRYNASRPLPVIGGVSVAEIAFLQRARGPGAKTQLCWSWLSEFIIREHLAGSLGDVGPPIISRTMQFLGEGMTHYNHARKIMFTPFPFPHAQLTVFFVIVTIPAVALLMVEYTDNLALACVLTFLGVTAMSGIHEVARELENPFRNVPNELPLVTFQAQCNESLLTMYAGYHPDHFWHDAADATILRTSRRQDEQPVQMNTQAMEEQMQLLMERLEKQELELERLRATSASSPNGQVQKRGEK